MFKYITVMFVAMFLVGCASTPSVITKTHRQAVVVDDAFFKEPQIPQPPDQKVYASSAPRDRELMLASHIRSLYGVIAEFQTQVRTIHRTMKKSEKLINEGIEP